MADFRTHLSVAAVGGSALAVAAWQAQLLAPGEAVAAALLTAFGGILPDVDSDHSHAVRLVFSVAAVLAVIAGAVLLRPWLEAGTLLVTCGGLYLAVRYVLAPIFKQFSVHRGIWHSLLAAVLCGLATSVASYQLLGEAATLAWSLGVALVIGFLIHLLLDELYSVDLEGTRIKRSFGTALKLFDYREPVNSAIMLIMVVALGYWMPPWQSFMDIWSQGVALWR